MIDPDNKIIYVDYSTLSTFKACKRKCQMGYILGYRTKESASALSMGHAIHAGYEAFYDAMAGGFHTRVIQADGTITKHWQKFTEPSDPVAQAKAAFLRDLKVEGASLPVVLEAPDHRSIERGLGLLEAYAWRWRNEPYKNLLDADGAPLTEVAFKYPLARWESFDLVYVGYIDRLMLNASTDRPVIFESKTTGQSPKVFIQQCNPNDQVTGYFPPARNLFPSIMECIWDVTFISKRQADISKALSEEDRFWMYGIDIADDYMRQVTTRSKTQITEFLQETEEWAVEYAKYLTSGKQWWPKTAPGACHSYGGCQFRGNACIVSEDSRKGVLDSLFEIKKWEPYKAVAAQAWWQE